MGVDGGPGQPQLGGDRADRHRVVAGDDLGADVLVGEVAQGVGRVRPQPLLQDDQGGGLRPLGHLGVVEVAFHPGEQQHPQALLVQPPGLGEGRVVVGQQDVRRAEQPGARLPVGLGERGAAVLACRGEGQRLNAAPLLAVRVGVDDRLQGGVRPRVRLAEGAEDLSYVRLVGVLERPQLGDVHAALGEGAGLVEADRVDPGQALDRGQLLDQALLAAQPDDADGEGDGGEQDQSLGDHGDDAADRAGDGVVEGVLLHEQLADDQADRGRDHHPRDVLEDRGDAGAQLGLDEGEAGGLLGQLGGVRLTPDLRRLERPAARDHETARHHLVAGALDDRVGLAGEQRLVDLQAVGLHADAVDHDFVAGADLYQVVEDDLGRADLTGGPVPAHGRPHLADQGEGVQCLLGPPLLDDPDAGVGEDHEAEEAVLDRRDDQHDQPQHADDRVEAGEDVRADDVDGGAAAAHRHVVDLPALHAFGYLSTGQAGHG